MNRYVSSEATRSVYAALSAKNASLRAAAVGSWRGVIAPRRTPSEARGSSAVA